MNIKPPIILTSLFCFLLISASAQEKPKKCRPAITDSKKLIGTIKLNDREAIEIVGKATYTITAFNSDESLEGTFIFAIADVERQQIARAMNKELIEIPSTISKQEVIAQFAKLSECPRLEFDFPTMELEISGAKMQVKRGLLNLKETDNEPTLTLCIIARQIKGGLSPRRNRRALYARLNCLEEKD